MSKLKRIMGRLLSTAEQRRSEYAKALQVDEQITSFYRALGIEFARVKFLRAHGLGRDETARLRDDALLGLLAEVRASFAKLPNPNEAYVANVLTWVASAFSEHFAELAAQGPGGRS
jgi:hypothetical protein